MALVKVWNDNVHPHRENFKGDWIEIPAKGFVEMEWEEAMDFKGQFTGIKLNADNTHDPTGFKMIRVEAPAKPIFQDESLICHADGKRAVTKEELEGMLTKFAHMRVVDGDAERAIPAGAPSYAELLQRVAALEARHAEVKEGKKKPGPKPKFFNKEAAG